MPSYPFPKQLDIKSGKVLLPEAQGTLNKGREVNLRVWSLEEGVRMLWGKVRLLVGSWSMRN